VTTHQYNPPQAGQTPWAFSTPAPHSEHVYAEAGFTGRGAGGGIGFDGVVARGGGTGIGFDGGGGGGGTDGRGAGADTAFERVGAGIGNGSSSSKSSTTRDGTGAAAAAAFDVRTVTTTFPASRRSPLAIIRSPRPASSQTTRPSRSQYRNATAAAPRAHTAH